MLCLMNIIVSQYILYVVSLLTLSVFSAVIVICCIVDSKVFGAMLSVFHINAGMLSFVSCGYDSMLWLDTV